ncbi:hypothetical protein [Amphibacillus cookii]|uniref:hypothetical protein n=1 Tax=Amphibacillus cookii TaxID=767787 RepID=UPI001956F4FB|nr:hypothetical protein [Amphibacillus cookii]MBM7541315.1 hypothetical protein [Amphibacillus cookii]
MKNKNWEDIFFFIISILPLILILYGALDIFTTGSQVGLRFIYIGVITMLIYMQYLERKLKIGIKSSILRVIIGMAIFVLLVYLVN